MIRRKHDFDLIVLGSGAGGAVGASYARSLGKSVALIEKDSVLGGECPNWACVPTKALLNASEIYRSAVDAKPYGISTGKVSYDVKKMRAWKNLVVSRTGSAEGDSIFTGEGIHLIKGKAKFMSGREVMVGKEKFSAKRFILATGSDTIIPPVTGLKQTGYWTFKDATEMHSVPKSILIVGGGPIGCEFAQLYSDLGVEVHLIEMAPRILIRDEPEVGELIEALFKDRGVNVITNALFVKTEKKYTRKVAHYKQGGHEHKVIVDEILIATGKKANLDFDHEAAGVRVDAKGRIQANRFLQTSNPRIFVAGDIIGPMQFTHTAAYQSRIAAHNAFNRKKIRTNYISIPRATFTRPEAAGVGMTDAEAKERGIKTRVGVAATAMIGRSNTSDQFDGFVKVVTDQRGIIVGASIVAPRAGEMIHELALAIKLRATAHEVAEMVHAFPTYSEAVKIACSNLG